MAHDESSDACCNLGTGTLSVLRDLAIRRRRRSGEARETGDV